MVLPSVTKITIFCIYMYYLLWGIYQHNIIYFHLFFCNLLIGVYKDKNYRPIILKLEDMNDFRQSEAV